MAHTRPGPHRFQCTATTGVAAPSAARSAAARSPSAAWPVHSLNGLGTKSSFLLGPAQSEGPQTANGLLTSLIVEASQPANGSNTLSTRKHGGCVGALLAVRGWHAPQKSTSFATATGPPSWASEPEPALASLSALVSVPSLFGDAGSFSPSSAPNAMADGGPGGLWRGEPPFTLGVVQGEGASELLGL